MARNVDVVVSFLDAGPKTATSRYRLRQTMADDGSDMDDVLSAAASLKTALDVLTWDKITEYHIEVIIPGGGAAPNVASNNQIHAYTRTLDALGNKSAFDVPAWDDDTFDRDENDVLSAAYDTAAAAVAALLANPDNMEDMVDVVWSQSRTHRTRGKVLS